MSRSSLSLPSHPDDFRAFAHFLHGLGFNVTAITRNKVPGHKWEHFQKERQTAQQLAGLPWRRAIGIGLISGVGGVRVFDFDGAENIMPLRTVLTSLGLGEDYPWRWRSGSGKGFGLAVLCSESVPLGALGTEVETGVYKQDGIGFKHLELRYSRCQTLLPPSRHPTGPGYRWLCGVPAGPPAVVSVDRVTAAFRSVTIPSAHGHEVETRAPEAAGERAGDEYARTHTWADILVPHGWRPVKNARAVSYWVRPGKDPSEGHSATSGGGGHDLLYVFSVNAPPFEPNHSYTKFRAYSLLEHNGDDRAAAREIYRLRARRTTLGVPGEPPDQAGPARNASETARANGNKKASSSRANQARVKVDSDYLLGFLADAGYTFRLNLCDDTVEVNGERITDALRCLIRSRLRDGGLGKYLNAAEDAWTASALRHAYHPVREYLESLPPWDGRDYIAELAGYFTDEYGVFGLYLRKWLIGAVRRIYTGHHSAVLVLEGSQNLGKSQFARYLCPLPQLFLDSRINPDSKDHELRAMRVMVWEVSELAGTIRASNLELLKGFLSRETFSTRAAYGHHETTKPGLASFIGTANDASGLFVDTTGSRRFLSVKLTAIDWSYTRVDVHNLWAQALSAYRGGEPCTLSAPEAERAAAINEELAVPNAVEDLLHHLYHIDPLDKVAWTSSAEILLKLQGDGVRGMNSTATAMAIAAAMKKLGVVKRKIGKHNGYAGVSPRTNLQPQPTFRARIASSARPGE